MRFTGDIRKMPDNPTRGHVGTNGLFYVMIEAQENDIFIERWQPFEITAEDVTFQDGQKILENRLKELRESAFAE